MESSAKKLVDNGFLNVPTLVLFFLLASLSEAQNLFRRETHRRLSTTTESFSFGYSSKSSAMALFFDSKSFFILAFTLLLFQGLQVFKTFLLRRKLPLDRKLVLLGQWAPLQKVSLGRRGMIVVERKRAS